MGDASGYTRNEVAFLLSLGTHDEALAYATRIVSSLGNLTNETCHPRLGAEDSDVPLIARWAEVHSAKQRIAGEKENLALLQLRLQGYTDEEVGVLLGLGRRTVGRRWKATLQEILDELGETEEVMMPLDHIDMCLTCGKRPRARTTSRTRIWTGSRWKVKNVERSSSSCSSCLERVVA